MSNGRRDRLEDVIGEICKLASDLGDEQTPFLLRQNRNGSIGES
jgi:hypothetical protein